MIDTLTNIGPLISVLSSPIVGVVTWFTARRKRQLEGIERLQQTIDMLLEKNCELTKQNIRLQEDVIRLGKVVSELKAQNAALSRKIRIAIENNRKIKIQK